MKAFSTMLLALCCAAAAAQQSANIQLLANVNDYPQSLYSDIWGFVDRAGREYAILGVRSGTAIYSLENPRSPRRVAFIPGAQSIWRDMKSYGNFIYAVADQGADGILAIDMSKAPDTITHVFHKINIGINPLNRCHNLYIDEKGSMFLSGCNINNGGVLLFDVATAPGVPKFLNGTNSRYSHDNFARGDTVWSSDVYLGEFSVLDVSNKQAPRLMATHPTSSRFTHNAWLSDDGRYLFTTDEKVLGSVDAYDVSDLENIKLLDRFYPKNAIANRAIPHNVHYYRGFLVTSWYTEGVIITDAHRPQNMVETGYYDTYPLDKQGFEGCWGAFPYLPSGLLLASDISTGLYVFRPEYKRAAYLEGTVRDAETGALLSGVAIRAPERGIQLTTDFFGAFKTGTPDEGIVRVIISADGYRSDTLDVNLQAGEVAELNIALAKIGAPTIGGTLSAQRTGRAIARGMVLLENASRSYSIPVNASGNFSLAGIANGEYALYAGAWGYKTLHLPSLQIEGSQTLSLKLEEGYYDDFVLDQGWRVSSEFSAPGATGAWERGIPQGTVFNGKAANPPADVDDDLGKACFVTGLFAGSSPTANDLSGGRTILSSPPMDLSGYENPELSYRLWFVNEAAPGESPPNDSLIVLISNADTTVILEVVTDSKSAWRPPSIFRLRDHIALDKPLTIRFMASDLPPLNHLTEAGVDVFQVKEGMRPTAVRDLKASSVGQLKVFPNPCSSDCQVQAFFPEHIRNARLEVFNVLGQRVSVMALPGSGMTAPVHRQSLQAGMYVLRLISQEGLLAEERMVVY